jgi:hypothetical protein
MASSQFISRYNNYRNDKYEQNNPDWAICARGDLSSSGATPGGCYDTKVTQYKWVETATAEAINGPTQSSGLPAFSWNQFSGVFHEGLPLVYNFTFQTMKPKHM